MNDSTKDIYFGNDQSLSFYEFACSVLMDKNHTFFQEYIIVPENIKTPICRILYLSISSLISWL